jgi:hypothetical protein
MRIESSRLAQYHFRRGREWLLPVRYADMGNYWVYLISFGDRNGYNCSSWVNSMLIYAGVSEADAAQIRDFSGLDFAEHKLIEQVYFKGVGAFPAPHVPTESKGLSSPINRVSAGLLH